MTDKTAKIRELNDLLRKERRALNGRIVLAGDLGAERPEGEYLEAILKAMADFDSFPTGNDPYQEHDFGKFIVEGREFMFKIDYYALDEQSGSEHPEDQNVTMRVLTIFYASDY